LFVPLFCKQALTMTDTSTSKHTLSSDEKVLDSIKPSKIILPTIIGLAVISWLVYKQLDLGELKAVQWTSASFGWILVAMTVYLGRHLLYSYRLRILSEGDFSWLKSIELVTILEFASAVSPSNFGGSAVAFFLLIQENISAARSTAIVIYTIIADTLFFVFVFPIMYILMGRIFFLPDASLSSSWDNMDTALIGVWLLMTAYGLVLLYGLFVQPRHIKRFLKWVAKWPLLSRSRSRIIKAAEDIEVSSRQIRDLPLYVHGKLAGATLLAWILRFFTVTAILLALNPHIAQSLLDHIIVLGRGAAIYAFTAYSPTPGGSGVAELVFNQFYSEYVSEGIAVIAALLWRIITYYPYLILGVIIIPNWIRKVVNRRREQKLTP